MSKKQLFRKIMFLINLYYKMDRNKIRSVLMTPSTHSTQQTCPIHSRRVIKRNGLLMKTLLSVN